MFFVNAALTVIAAGLLTEVPRLGAAAPVMIPAGDAADFLATDDARAAPIDVGSGDTTGVERRRRFGWKHSWLLAAAEARMKVAPLSVCESGAFSPDPSKYYTIAVGQEYWAQNTGEDPWTGRWTDRQNTPGKHVVLQSDNVGLSAHWRFVQHTSGRNVYWNIINRLTGLKLSLRDGRMETDYTGISSLAATCSHTSVSFPLAGVQNGGVRCDEDGCRVGGRLNGWPHKKRETKGTGCVVNSSCSKKLGAGWVQTSKTSFFFCTSYQCERYVDVKSQESVQGWSVREVAEFRPRDRISPPEINLADDTFEVYAKSLASAAVGTALSTALPFGAAIVSAAISHTIPGGDSIESKLESFAEEFTEVTNALISTGMSEAIVEAAQLKFEMARRKINFDYPREMIQILGRTVAGSPDREDDLYELAENELQSYGQDLEDATAQYFIYDTSAASEVDIKRAQIGWSAMKGAMIETLAVFQEAVLLKAYAVPEGPGNSCDDFYSGLAIDYKVAHFRSRLVDIQQMLVTTRVNPIGASRDSRMYDSEAHDDFGASGALDRWGNVIGRTELYYASPGSLSPARDVANAYKAEIEFDLRIVTHSFSEVAAFLDGFEQATMEACAQVRVPGSATREIFEKYEA